MLNDKPNIPIEVHILRELIVSHPEIILTLAALVSETGLWLLDSTRELISEFAKKSSIRKFYKDRQLWPYLKRLLKAPTPSLGLELLRSTGVLKIFLPELNNCYKVSQNKKYHKYDVFEHLLLACDRCITNDVRLKLATLLHDIGKPATRKETEIGITFHKHEVLGKKLARRVVTRLGMEIQDANFVVELVGNHMYQYDRAWKDSTVRRFIRKTGLSEDTAGKIHDFPLFQLRDADRMGRDLAPITQKQKDFEERLTQTLFKDKPSTCG
ncbi:MAG TPA: HD domain-containing protein [bacterium]|nr:HD domain-containing protein [bacterium]